MLLILMHFAHLKHILTVIFVLLWAAGTIRVWCWVWWPSLFGDKKEPMTEEDYEHIPGDW